MMKALGPLSRRRFLTASASLGIGTIAAPYVARADDPTLRIVVPYGSTRPGAPVG